VDKTELLSLSYKAARLDKQPEDLPEGDFQKFLTYTDKESYLKWVSDWKAEYKEHSENTRTIRANTKSAQRENKPEASAMQADLDKRSRYARMMIIVRKAGKRHSWALRESATVAA